MNICNISERISGQNRISLLGFQHMYGGHYTLSKGSSAFLILQSPQCFYPCKFHDFRNDEGSEICKVWLCL